MPAGYIIALVTITNPQQYEEYKRWSSEAMRVHGAEICVRGDRVEVLEGDWHPGRTVILKFPSFEAAQSWYHSPGYSSAKQLREGAVRCRASIVDGKP